jgi:ABC-type transporter lipoprotein component MlaA
MYFFFAFFFVSYNAGTTGTSTKGREGIIKASPYTYIYTRHANTGPRNRTKQDKQDNAEQNKTDQNKTASPHILYVMN